jgi:AraC family transcriptional regulator
MNRPPTLLDYSRRIQRTVAWIADHLDDPIRLDALAEVACFSPCHFHRIYRHLTGETPAETIRRLRLHRAAGELVQGRRDIAEVASRAGYGSVAAFTRSFRSGYGMPPAAYRRSGRLIAPDITIHPETTTMYSVDIRDVAPIHLAALSHTGPYNDIGPAFDRLFVWAQGRGLVGPDTRSIAVYHDDPGTVPASELRSHAGITVEPDVAAQDDVHILEVAGGRHAVIRHEGPYAELEKAYAWLYGEWLPTSGFEAADRPCYEEYVNDPRTLPPARWLTDIYLPIAD